MKTLSKLSLLSFILIILIQCQKRPSSLIKNRWSEERAGMGKGSWMDGRYKF